MCRWRRFGRWWPNFCRIDCARCSRALSEWALDAYPTVSPESDSQSEDAERMKIAIIQDPGRGGAERHLAELAAAARRNGHTPTLYGLDRGGIDAFLERGIPHVPQEFVAWRKVLKRLGSACVQILKRRPSAVRRVADEMPDVVVAGDLWTIPHAVGIAKRCGVPALGFVQADGLRSGALRKYKATQCAALLVPSIYMQFKLSVDGLPRERIHVIRPGVDLERFHPDVDGCPVREELEIPEKAFVVGCVGTISPAKGQAFLLELIAHRPPDSRLILLFIGDAERPDARRLLHRAVELNLRQRVAFTGYRQDMPSVLAACDAVAVPSRAESFSLALAEAMAMGLPTVYSGTGGTPEVTGQDDEPRETGAVRVGLDQSQRWLEELTWLERDLELRHQRGVASRRHAVAELGPETGVKAFLDVLQRVVGGSSVDTPR